MLRGLLRDPPPNGTLPGPDAPISVLGCLDGRDERVLAQHRIYTLQDLALFEDPEPTAFAQARQSVPLLPELVLHAKAILSSL